LKQTIFTFSLYVHTRTTGCKLLELNKYYLFQIFHIFANLMLRSLIKNIKTNI